MGLWAIVFLGSTPIGSPVIGFIAGHLGTRSALAVGGAAAVLASLGAAVSLRRLRVNAAAKEMVAPAPAGVSSSPVQGDAGAGDAPLGEPAAATAPRQAAAPSPASAR
jgi:hypothetical protein